MTSILKRSIELINRNKYVQECQSHFYHQRHIQRRDFSLGNLPVIVKRELVFTGDIHVDNSEMEKYEELIDHFRKQIALAFAVELEHMLIRGNDCN